MALTTPKWLTQRDGEVRPGTAGHSWFVVFDGAPQYKLVAAPAAGKYSCEIVQTINSRRFPSNALAATAEDAVQAGLEDLRKVLGW